MDHVSTANRLLRARATNSIFAFPGNGRTAEARRFKDVLGGLLRDLGKSEADLSDTMKVQLRNTALLTVQVEQLHERVMAGEPADVIDLLVRQQGLLNRMHWMLGLSRRKRNTLTPEDAADPVHSPTLKDMGLAKPRSNRRTNTATAGEVQRYIAAKETA